MSSEQADGAILQVHDAGVRYRRGWALRHCELELSAGSITALVGPNGAGKSTLMLAAAGLLELTEGRIDVLGAPAGTSPGHPELSYLGQARPLYRQFTVDTMLELARHLNTSWDGPLADRLCEEARLDRGARVRTLSGGQRTRLALAIVLARRPTLVLLDEPLAELDPLARLEVAQTLLAQAADSGLTVLMSSHVLSEIEDACDHLALLTGGRITLHAPIEHLVQRHRLLTGPDDDETTLATLRPAAVEIRRSVRQVTVLLDGRPAVVPEGWTEAEPTLEEVVIARLRAAAEHREAA
jgi:ABC-2 type transport system ATP-binding protein